MKIIDIQTEVKYIALKTPFITALRRVDTIEFVRVKIIFDDGSFSFGEAPATKAITGEDIESILNSIASIKGRLISLIPSDAIDVLHLSKIKSSAKAVLDMALFLDLKVDKNITIKTDITISLNSSAKMLQDAKEALRDGMNILKVKLGSDIDHAIEVTKKLANLDAKLLIDANQAWNLQKSLRYIDALKEFDIELIEQPVPADELDDLKLITNYSTIPILADESVFTLQDVIKVIESKSADMINIKLMKCGGVTKAIEILEYARKNGIKCMLGSMLEGPISINAALYLATIYDDIIEYVDLDSPLLYKETSNELEFSYDGCKISHR